MDSLKLLDDIILSTSRLGPSPAAPSAPSTPVSPTAPAAPATPTAPVTEKPQQESVKPADDTPKYGGTLTLAQATDLVQSDLHNMSNPGRVLALTHELIWNGNWALGIAGGYGARKTDWRAYYYNFDLLTGYVAESYTWSFDVAKDEATVVLQIRRGVNYAQYTKSEASLLARGRELTADDVVLNMKRAAQTPGFRIYLVNPDFRNVEIVKTGPWEVTLKTKASVLMPLLNRFLGKIHFMAPEVWQKYGAASSEMTGWKVASGTGTGPFILADYIPGSSATLLRNPGYWMKDPVGPGKGNQLPYLDEVRFLIIPDASTRAAALRTGKVDHMPGVTWEDALQVRETARGILEAETPPSRGVALAFNNQRAPFNDVRVRRALLQATDLKTMNDSLFGGKAQINTYPYPYVETYADLYLALDAPDFPASTRELFSYNPEKAKQLLAEAGYTNGFKASILLTAADVDFYSIVKDMWAKVGVDVALKVRESGALRSLLNAGDYDLTPTTGTALAQYYDGVQLVQERRDTGNVQDPVLNEGYTKVRIAAARDSRDGMLEMRELSKYIIEKVYHLPIPTIGSYVFWWPWVRNYSGEEFPGSAWVWPQFVWYDQTMKKKMGF